MCVVWGEFPAEGVVSSAAQNTDVGHRTVVWCCNRPSWQWLKGHIVIFCQDLTIILSRIIVLIHFTINFVFIKTEQTIWSLLKWDFVNCAEQKLNSNPSNSLICCRNSLVPWTWTSNADFAVHLLQTVNGEPLINDLELQGSHLSPVHSWIKKSILVKFVIDYLNVDLIKC